MENNNSSNTKFLASLYNEAANAERAYDLLINRGYAKEDITVVMSDATRDKYFAQKDMPENSLGTKAVEGMGVGSAIGGTIGAIAAAIAAVGTALAIPGLGLIIAGPIAAGLAGAGAGSAVGGLVGALVGAGFSDERAKEYEEEIKNGGILVGIKVPADQYNTLESDLKNTAL
ncbi:MAG: hypothetical protein EOP33_00490 [Rickettsiaceae bacterium]|nr:MAG: hypothetical protein EOP33_00490 [Rickettsiaceae bacterium]